MQNASEQENDSEGVQGSPLPAPNLELLLPSSQHI